MKKVRKLLRLCLVLALVMSSLTAGMSVSALNRKSDVKAFQSITVGGKKVRDIEDWAEVDVSTRKPKVKVKLRSGWKLKKIVFHHGNSSKAKKVKNGGTIKLTGGFDNYVKITATKGGKTAKVEFQVYRM